MRSGARGNARGRCARPRGEGCGRSGGARGGTRDEDGCGVGSEVHLPQTMSPHPKRACSTGGDR